jgi:hypothetical protein
MARRKGFLFPGDTVRATRAPELDPDGLPRQHPVVGQTYVLTSIYLTPYGCGCTLAGLDASPYAGYILRRNNNLTGKHRTYFELVEGE